MTYNSPQLLLLPQEVSQRSGQYLSGSDAYKRASRREYLLLKEWLDRLHPGWVNRCGLEPFVDPETGVVAWRPPGATAKVHILRAVFRTGPLGFGIKQIDDVVQVTSVDPGSQASAQGLVMGSFVVEVAGSSVAGLDRPAVMDAIKRAERPVMILFDSSRVAFL